MRKKNNKEIHTSTTIKSRKALVMAYDANYQKVVKGLVLLAAVIFDVISKKKNA